MYKYKFLDLSVQYKTIKDEIDFVIDEIITTSSFVGGPHLKKFEDNFAKFTNTSHCIGVGNGTDALEIAIESLNLPANSEIIVPSNSFIASSEAVTRSGHKIVFADVDSSTYNINISTIKNLITASTKAIIVVHLYGLPAPMHSILELCGKYNLKIIEDCAQAHGSYINNQHVGSFGDIAAFSFYPGKNLGAYGDGGAIITNNEHLASRCRLIANHGRFAKYDHEIEGRNSRLDTLQAAILDIKLIHLPQWIIQRNKNARIYLDILDSCQDLVLPILSTPEIQHSFHLFVVRLAERNKLMEFLAQKGIPTGIHYPTALPALPPYKSTHHYTYNYFAISSAENLLSLPVGEHLNESDIKAIALEIKSFFVG